MTAMATYRVLQPCRYLNREYMPGDTVTGEEFGPPPEIHWLLRLQALIEITGNEPPTPPPEPEPGEPVAPISTTDAPVREPARRR